jgi:arylsulfate sulfotransferase
VSCHMLVNKISFLTIFSFTLSAAFGDTLLWVGFDTSGPVQVYSSSLGTPSQGSFGPSDASGVALDHAGHLWLNEPGASKSVITKLDQNLHVLGTINFTQGIDNGNGSPSYIEDMAYGGSNTLWLAGYNGIIYHVDSSGNTLSHFDTGDPFTGIATNGTELFTSQGLSGAGASSGLISEYSFTGALLGTIDTGLSQSFGLAFDPTSGDLFVGGTDSITKVDLNGNVLASSFVPGADHTGLDVGLIGGTAPAKPAFLIPVSNVPEPSGGVFVLLGLGALLLLGKRAARLGAFFLLAIALACLGVPKAFAAITNLQLTPSLPSPQPLGTAINFQATATGAADYQFNVQGPLDTSFHLLRDYTGFGNAVWSTIDHEGVYQIQVIARNTNTGDTATLVVPFTLTSLATTHATVSVTPHPQVALYSAPPCPAGSTIRVRWIAGGSVYWNVTPFKSCVAGLSMNFYVAGMLAKTTYYFQQDVFTGPHDVRGPLLAFSTGATAIPIPATTIVTPAVAPSSIQEPILLHSYISTNPAVSAYAIASDLTGRVLWYGLGGAFSLVRPVPGGTFLVLGNTNPTSTQTHVLQEIDLVGNVIRETNASRISEQLIARGNQPVSQFHHDARRLSNGNTVVLGTVELNFNNVQGATGPVDILGDEIMVLDPNFKLLWAWSTFDHLNINDTAPLGETCKTAQPGCPPLLTPVNGVANDWTHSNSIDYLATDGSLLLSIRNQDKVLKINYANGTGDGSVLMTLGKAGDVTLTSNDPYPWFSHQHDANYEPNAQHIQVFDDGNTRIAAQGPTAHSRGQVYNVDSVAKTATLLLNADLGTYSPALGSAQVLLNGNHHFASGAVGLFGMPAKVAAHDVEVGSSGTIVFDYQTASAEYRSFRMQSLYVE